jgi:nitrite reductase/ring-hydroxylating ferredoxin subunit/uncharacterized membrane protein
VRPLFKESVYQLERLDVLDRLAAPLGLAVRRLVPPGSSLKDLLSGTWYGDPLHPPLTDVVIGSWTSAVMLDWLGGRPGRASADRLIGLGILAAVPAAAAGLSDWSDVTGPARRIGVVHAAANVSGLSLFTLSWLARKGGHRIAGKSLALLGIGVASAAGYLGGHLSFERGVGVNRTAFLQAPKRWTKVMAADALPEGTLTGAAAGGLEVVLFRRGDRVDALADRCSHRGCALQDGHVEESTDAVVCPCHGSTFRLRDGAVLRGPATAPQPALDARIQEGNVEVQARG